jgi:hypothetical protein
MHAGVRCSEATTSSREHGIHGRARVAEHWPEPVRSPATVDPRPEDGLDGLRPGQPRGVPRSRAAVLETQTALGPISPNPLVGGRSTDALCLSGLGRRPAVKLDPSHQELSAKDVETRRTMGHEGFLQVWVLNTPNHAELSFVNNVLGNHI